MDENELFNKKNSPEYKMVVPVFQHHVSCVRKNLYFKMLKPQLILMVVILIIYP